MSLWFFHFLLAFNPMKSLIGNFNFLPSNNLPIHWIKLVWCITRIIQYFDCEMKIQNWLRKNKNLEWLIQNARLIFKPRISFVILAFFELSIGLFFIDKTQKVCVCGIDYWYPFSGSFSMNFRESIVYRILSGIALKIYAATGFSLLCCLMVFCFYSGLLAFLLLLLFVLGKLFSSYSFRSSIYLE